MYNNAVLFLDIIMVFIEIWVVHKFLETVCSQKRSNIRSVIAWIIFGSVQFYLEINKGNASIIITLVSIAIVFLVAVSNYKNVGKTQFFYIILLYVVWAISEMIVFCMMKLWAVDETKFAMTGSVISNIIIIIFVYIWSEYHKKSDMTGIPTVYYMMLLFVPIGSIYIAVNVFFSSQDDNYQLSSMMTFCILLMINIIIFEICSKLAKNSMLEREKALYAQQLAIVSRHTDEQKKMMEEFHEQRHNMLNELIVLKNCIEYGENTKAILALEQMIHSCRTETILNSGNTTVDAIVNSKYAIAKEMGIAFKTKVFIPEQLPIEPCDLGIVIGNALDNAIEGTKACKMPIKTIHIIIGVKKEALVITIKNPFEGKLITDKEGKLLSTKTDKDRHGYGVSSMKKVVEKYNGELIIDEKDNIFVLTVILYM